MYYANATSEEPRATANHDTSFKVYNDLHFRPAHPPTSDSWPIFPLLLPELRLRIWQCFLQRHRMIELEICAGADEDGTQSRYDTERNHLGNIISGRGYSLLIEGRGFAASLSPLLQVSSEARHAALTFYRVHLPFPGQHGEQVLYLNPEFDVLYVRPGIRPPTLSPTEVSPVAVLIDFLNDMRAYDPKDRGYAISRGHLSYLVHI